METIGRTWGKGIVAWLLGVSSALGWIVSGAVAGENLTKRQKATVEAAIQILKDYEECCDPTPPDGMDADVSIADCLETILANSNICKGGRRLPTGVAGKKTLDDTSANCGDNDVILVAANLVKGKTRSKFPLLLMVLYHEAVHALQDLSDFETSDYKEKTTAKLEKQAWTAQKGVLEKFEGALQKILDNIDAKRPRDTDLDDCERKLMACFLDEEDINEDKLKKMHGQAEEALDTTTSTLEALCDTIDEECPPKPPAEGKPRGETAENETAAGADDDEEDQERAGPFDPNHKKTAVTFPRTGSVLWLERDAFEAPFRFPLSTGLTEVFGIAWQRDLTLRDHLVLCGHRAGAGFVQIWRDDTPDVADVPLLITELAVDPVTSAPSGLAPFGPDGTGGLLVWDELRSELFALVDSDADGVVDTLDPTPRNLLPVPTFDLVELEVDFVDDVTGVIEYTLSPIALGCMTGDQPWVSVVDVDADGFFTPSDVSYRGDPLDDPRRGPAFGATPMEGFTSVIVAGASGHDVQLWRSDEDGVPLVPLTSVATIGAANEATLAVTNAGGLVLDDLVAVRDLTNGKTSLERPVEAARAQANRAFGNRSAGTGGAVVFQRGTGLDTLSLQEVLVGGNPALTFTVDATGVTYTAPPNTPVPGDGVTDASRIVAVELLHDDGTGELAVLPAQALSYADPILTDDYECRKGNVGAASGVVADVVFVNDFAGNGSSRVLVTTPTEPFRFEIFAPPSRPGGPSKYVMYAWVGAPSPTSVVPLPRGTGSICRHTPLDGPPGLPKRIANNLGKPQLGTENWPGPATLPAPYVLLDDPAGLGLVGTFTFQGVVLDSDAPNGVIAVTNAVLVDSRP